MGEARGDCSRLRATSSCCGPTGLVPPWRSPPAGAGRPVRRGSDSTAEHVAGQARQAGTGPGGIVAEWLVEQFLAGCYPGLVVGSPLAQRPEKPSRNPAFAKVTGKRPCKRGNSLMTDSDDNMGTGEPRGEL